MWRSVIGLICAAGLVLAACSGGQPPATEWRLQHWTPLVEVVPEPDQATPAVCEEALSRLRERSENLQPAPDPDLGNAADAWLRRAETLVFDCASETPEQDYRAGYEDLNRLGDEVRSLLDSSP